MFVCSLYPYLAKTSSLLAADVTTYFYIIRYRVGTLSIRCIMYRDIITTRVYSPHSYVSSSFSPLYIIVVIPKKRRSLLDGRCTRNPRLALFVLPFTRRAYLPFLFFHFARSTPSLCAPIWWWSSRRSSPATTTTPLPTLYLAKRVHTDYNRLTYSHYTIVHTYVIVGYVHIHFTLSFV